MAHTEAATGGRGSAAEAAPLRADGLVKGTVHVAIGASAPVGLVITQHVTLLQGATMAAVSAGFALLPDLDNPNACASKALGRVVHNLVHMLCKTAFNASATRRDNGSKDWMLSRMRDPYHRTLTHTLAAVVTVWAIAYGAAYASGIVTGFLAACGVILMWPLHRRSVGLVVAGALAAATGSAMLLDPWLFSLAVGGGYLSHIVADACTTTGVPALWPVQIKGKRWWNIRLLDGLVRSGSSWERGPAVGVSLSANALLVILQF